MLKQTPFHLRTAPLVRAQTWRRWAGHEVASAYEPHPDREYAAIRASAAMIVVSPLHKYRISGRDAARLLDRMVRNVMKCAVGQVLYTPWCNAAGKVIDDGNDQPARRRHVSSHERGAKSALAGDELDWARRGD
jgi:aminomethyltransferase